MPDTSPAYRAAKEVEPECWAAIYADGEMKAVVGISDDHPHIHEEAVAEWVRDPEVTQILRLPISMPRRFLFEPWPGFEAARAADKEDV